MGKAKISRSAGKATSKVDEHQTSRLWASIGSLHEDNANLRSEVVSIGTRVDGIMDAIRQLRDTQSDMTAAQKTPWNVIFAGLTVLILVTASIGGAALAPLYLSDQYHGAEIHDHQTGPGHPEALMMHTRANKDIERIDGDVQEVKSLVSTVNDRSDERHQRAMTAIQDLDDALQREMRDLDTIQANRIESLDGMLQREMRFIDDIQSAKRQGLESRMNGETHLRDSLTKRFDGAEERLRQLQMNQAERLSDLEAKMAKAVFDVQKLNDRDYWTQQKELDRHARNANSDN